MKYPLLILLISLVNTLASGQSQADSVKTQAAQAQSASMRFDAKDMKPGATYQLEHLYFEMDRHTFMQESMETLGKLLDFLNHNPTLHIRIEGHVCCVADSIDAYDFDTNERLLSLNRAKAVHKYLVDKGIDPARLSYVGYGRSKPIIPNEQSHADAEVNRRVEIRIIGD